MNSFELNKVAGAVLGTLLFAFGTGFLAELIYTPKPAGNAGYALPGGSEGGEHGGAAPAGGGEAAAPKAGIAALLASADAEKGKAGTKACQACHSFEKGGPNKVGPDLWEIVGRKKGAHEGFGYSDAMKAKGGDWTYEDLDHFLTKPSEYVKGTKMSFQGISNAQERANVIAYLRTLSESPKPLPAAEAKDEGKKDGGKPEGDKKAEAKPAAGGDPVTARVASADAATGKGETKVCQACHSFEKGGPNKMGPDLWGVVGRKKGSHEGFDYSAGMKGKGGDWTVADLDQFLTKPAEYVKGTKMAFQGIASPEKRAAVIAYLNTLSDNPKPLAGADKKDDAGKTEAKKDDAKGAEAGKKPEEAKKPEDAKSAAPAQQPEAAQGQGQGQQNAAPPAQAPEAKPTGDVDNAKPAAPSSPNATEPAAKPDPAAEEKAKQEQKPDEKPAQQ